MYKALVHFKLWTRKENRINKFYICCKNSPEKVLCMICIPSDSEGEGEGEVAVFSAKHRDRRRN